MTSAGLEPGICSLRGCRPDQLDEGAEAIPAGLEPRVSALKGPRPFQLDEGIKKPPVPKDKRSNVLLILVECIVP